MSSKAEKERLKQIQEKCQNLLMQMLKDDDNKYCVDCDAKGPRWASWNIGIFLCIRCAGIHRNLGVHISRVKSVNLDTWTPEQVVSLQQMGNSRARAVYEANIPDNFRRPQTDSTLEAFIRAKYEQKKYIASEWVPPALPKVNWDKEFDEEAEKARRKKKDATRTATTPVPVRPPLSSVPVPAPLPKPMSSSPKTSRNKTAVTSTSPATSKQNANTSNLSADLLGLDISSSPDPVSQAPISTAANNSLDSEFNSFLSANTASPAPTIQPSTETNRTAEEDNFFNQPAPSAQTKKQLTTDSILALYGKSQPAPAQMMPQAMFTPQVSGIPQNISPFPGQPAFGSPFGSRAPVPAQTMPFPAESNAMFPNNQFVANPFYSMGAQVPGTLPQTNGQQFSFPTPTADPGKVLNGYSTDHDLANFDAVIPPSASSLHLQMGSLNLSNPTGVPQHHPMSLPGQTGAFPTQNNFFNQATTQPPQPLNPLGQTLSNNLWQ
uniref:Stromal membrane-associated protein 2 n=1 Tax=Cacopsylla melanoneura TaxID=428564 RepID=A0A8D8RF22_9HEMI